MPFQKLCKLSFKTYCSEMFVVFVMKAVSKKTLTDCLLKINYELMLKTTRRDNKTFQFFEFANSNNSSFCKVLKSLPYFRGIVFTL